MPLQVKPHNGLHYIDVSMVRFLNHSMQSTSSIFVRMQVIFMIFGIVVCLQFC